MVTLNIRIPDDLNSSLVLSAKELNRSKGYIARKALENYFIELQEDLEDAKIALARIKNPNRKFHSSEEMQQLLEKKLNV